MFDDWTDFKAKILNLKGLAHVGISNIITRLIPGIFWFYMATLLGEEGYGEISYLLAVGSIVYSISFLGIGNTIIVHTAKEEKIQSSLYALGSISGIIGSIIIYFIFQNIGVSIFVIGASIFGILISEALGLKSYKDFAKFQISQRILMVILAISLYQVLGLDGVIIGYGLSYIPFSYYIMKGLKSSKIEFQEIKNKFGFMMHSYSLSLGRTLGASADKLLIMPIFGFAFLANYQLGLQMLSVLGIVPISVYQYILPQEAIGRPHRKLKILTVILSIVIGIIAMMLGPLVLPLLFPDFEGTAEIIQIMSLGIIPMTVSFMYISKFFGTGKSKIVLIGSIVFISIQLSFIIILGEIYGIIGLALAVVLGYSTQSVFFVVADRITFKTSVKN